MSRPPAGEGDGPSPVARSEDADRGERQGKVNEGTFGVVFKAVRAAEKSNYEDSVGKGQAFPSEKYFAIKKPKNNAREGEGFNKDAVREIALLMELKRGTGLFCPPSSLLAASRSFPRNLLARKFANTSPLQKCFTAAPVQLTNP